MRVLSCRTADSIGVRVSVSARVHRRLLAAPSPSRRQKKAAPRAAAGVAEKKPGPTPKESIYDATI
jgi:hypothetical protein